MINHLSNDYDQLVERYLGLESMEVTEILLDMCGATIDERALPLLKQRLQEEQAQVPLLETRGYIRLREKSEQMVTALLPLIAALEATGNECNVRLSSGSYALLLRRMFYFPALIQVCTFPGLLRG